MVRGKKLEEYRKSPFEFMHVSFNDHCVCVCVCVCECKRECRLVCHKLCPHSYSWVTNK